MITVCPPHNWLPDELRRAGVHTLPLPMRGAGSVMTLLHLVRVVREQRIDIIHTHLTRATYYGLLLGLLTRKPVVSTVHVFTSDPAYRWLSRLGNPLIAVSEAVRRWLIEHGVPASEVQTIYNATDFVSLNGAHANAPQEVRKEFGLPESSKLIGLFAKVTPIKGQDLLLEALPQVLRSHPDTHVLFVGSTNGEFARRIQQRAKELSVSRHVVFTGLRADVARLMQAVDVVTLPSRTETFGLAVLEAMALGKPVVATRVGGLPELVRDGETGILVDYTTASLAHALNELLSSADLRHRLGQTARTFACQYYTPEHMVQRVEAVYARALTA
ncbi:N-acetyl-alpha-D-glucosaminyl L-malate synthase [bacterium HR16]|nr:N-acetyl-alpha-D-glucosaminyl L-malate synthase [bacterium HR16]